MDFTTYLCCQMQASIVMSGAKEFLKRVDVIPLGRVKLVFHAADDL